MKARGKVLAAAGRADLVAAAAATRMVTTTTMKTATTTKAGAVAIAMATTSPAIMVVRARVRADHRKVVPAKAVRTRALIGPVKA